MGPGKFSDLACEALWDLSLDGACEADHGDVSEDGVWYGLLTSTGVEGAEHAILCEDDQGFVRYESFATAERARAAFDRVCDPIAVEDHCGECGNYESECECDDADLPAPGAGSARR